MKARPFCFACLMLLLIISVIFILDGGNSKVEIPASSIFYNGKKETVTVEGQVFQKASTENVQILYLKNNSVNDSKLMIYDENFTNIPIGKIVKLRGELGFFEYAKNPGNFDQSVYFATRKIYGYIWLEELISISGEENRFQEGVVDLKIKLKQLLLEEMGEKYGTILAAMLLGEKSGMDEETKELYQKNGIGHVLAISGLHISFIGLGIYQLLKKIRLPFAVSGVVAIGILIGYVAMIGMTVSVFRAFVMLLLRIGADICGRVYDMMTAWALAAVLTVLYQPMYLSDGGFYLSYGAIAGILFVQPALKEAFQFKSKNISNLMVSVSVNMALFPILLWFYYEISPYSVALNLLVVPLMSVLLGVGIAGSIFGCFWGMISGWCFRICSLILYLFEWLSEIAMKLPHARIVLGKPKGWEVALYYSVLLCLLCFKGKKLRKIRWILLLIPIMCMGYRHQSDLRITMLDVGQGDGIFIEAPSGHTYFIDGGSSDVKQLGKYRIEPFLCSQGVGELDYVFLSHGDSDHCNGIEEMLARQKFGIRIKNLVMPANFKRDETLCLIAEEAQKYGTKVLVIEAGERIKEGELCIQCIQPGREDVLEGNASSMVLDISYKEFDMLCTGDVEGEGEELLIENLTNKTYEVLKVAHHGSKNSGSIEFLKKVQPKMGLISVGENNSYGHPHKETLKRLREANCRWFQTNENGAITLRTDGNTLTISTFP